MDLTAWRIRRAAGGQWSASVAGFGACREAVEVTITQELKRRGVCNGDFVDPDRATGRQTTASRLAMAASGSNLTEILPLNPKNPYGPF